MFGSDKEWNSSSVSRNLLTPEQKTLEKKALYCDKLGIYGETVERSYPSGFGLGYVRDAPMFAPQLPALAPIVEEEGENDVKQSESTRSVSDNETFASTASKEVSDSAMSKKINEAIEKIINLKIISNSQHQSYQSQDNEDKL
ncbi:hypothetical protein V2J09_016332 [Rumex salicifolius]